jgi:hypothetical protein
MLSAKGKGLLAGSLIALRGAFNIAAFSAKAFGLAVLNAIPVIGQIILVISIAWSYLSDFFSEPPSALEEALEENKKRFDEFPGVIKQMNAAIAASKTKSEEFLAALKPTTGILNQIVDASQNLLNVQQNEQIEKQVAARMELIEAEQELARAKKAAEQAGLDPEKTLTSFEKIQKILLSTADGGMATGYGPQDGVQQVIVNGQVENSLERLAAAEQALQEIREKGNSIDTLETTKGVQRALVKGISVFEEQKISLADNAEAVELLDQKINGLQGILTDLSAGLLSPQGAVEAMQRLASEQREVLESANAAKEAVQGITELFAAAERPSGVFADHIERLGNVIQSIKPGQDYEAILQLYEKVFKAYDVDSIESLEYILKTMKKINEETALKGVQDEFVAQQAMQLRAIGAETLALELELQRIGQNKALLEQRFAMQARTDVNAARQTALEIEKLTTKELEKQLQIMNQKVADANRLGGGIMAAGVSMSQASAFVGDDSSSLEKIIALNAAAQQTLQNLKNLGPEGEVYSAMFGGILNITESWTMAIETIGDTSLSTAERMSAAFMAVGTTINAIGQIQQAQAQASAAAIDKEIQAEKRRDGKSKESVAKIAAMEKRKEAIKKKAFEQDKKMKMASVIASTAMSVASNLAAASAAAAMAGPAAPAVFSSYLALMNGITIAMGAAQLAVIAGTSYQGGGSLPSGGGEPTSIALGQRKQSVDLAKSRSARGELAYFRGESGTGGPEAFTPAFSGYRNRAEGGNTAFMVGEQGPELFVPQVPGRIVPNDDIAPMTSTNVSFNINTIDASGVEDLLVEQRGNIIGMIRQAANSYGQDFFEGVDTSVFTPSAGGVNRY